MILRGACQAPTIGSRVCMEGEAIKESVVLETSESRKLTVDERVENGDGE